MNKIAFPGLGLSFEIDPVAFTLFGLEVKWYGVILTIGILSAFLLFYWYAKQKERLPEDHLYNLALFCVPIAIVGARFVYVATSWEHYKNNLAEIFNLRAGGLAIYGAVIFGAITLLIYTHVTKLSHWKALDAVAPGVLLGQIIGRWGNFFNAEAYGHSEHVEEWFLRMEITKKTGDVIVCHPTFLYEGLWNLVGLLLIVLLLYPRKKFDGEIFCVYLGWYGLGRSWIEVLRTDSLYIFGGTVKFSIFVGICSVILCIIGFFWLPRRQKKQEAEATYTGKYQSADVETVFLEEANANASSQPDEPEPPMTIREEELPAQPSVDEHDESQPNDQK